MKTVHLHFLPAYRGSQIQMSPRTPDFIQMLLLSTYGRLRFAIRMRYVVRGRSHKRQHIMMSSCVRQHYPMAWFDRRQRHIHRQKRIISVTAIICCERVLLLLRRVRKYCLTHHKTSLRYESSFSVVAFLLCPAVCFIPTGECSGVGRQDHHELRTLTIQNVKMSA